MKEGLIKKFNQEIQKQDILINKESPGNFLVLSPNFFLILFF